MMLLCEGPRQSASGTRAPTATRSSDPLYKDAIEPSARIGLHLPSEPHGATSAPARSPEQDVVQSQVPAQPTVERVVPHANNMLSRWMQIKDGTDMFHVDVSLVPPW